ncbi:LysM peptidoglycan-binding domain-containing protein [Sulfurovum sp.]|uniref:LysM peptidoglycan-binding domain-containing protein n=1 Tax=Sulfurovum sp. TaxID=1969726 RepID=UPI0035656906
MAQNIVDCRVVTGGTTECYPYGSKLIRAKEIKYDMDTKKLIISKTLPIPKKSTLKVISVKDMLEKYVKIEDSLRFKGSEQTPLKVKVVKKPVSQEIVEEKIEEIKISEIPSHLEKEPVEVKEVEKTQIAYGKYIVVSGDALSKLAKKFGLTTKALAKMNGIKSNANLYIGQKLKLPYEQKMIDSLASAEYRVEAGDTLISIAKKFDLDPKALVKFNSIKSNTAIRTGKSIKLPLPYVLAQKKKDEAKKKRLAARKKSGKVNLLQGFGKHKLRVTATAYSSHVGQTDSTPFLAAWNNRLRPGMKIIAVSRDMLTKYGMRNGTRVRIGGLPGYYRVRDKMNKRYKKRIDIYMGVDRRKALRWGRRSVVIYW